MPVEITEKREVNREKARLIETRALGEDGLVQRGTKPPQTIPQPGPQFMQRRRLLIGVLGVLILVAACVFGISWIREMLNTVSTDDAYVNGHVTFVAPRVSGRLCVNMTSIMQVIL